jgi:DNA-binding transcriptional LysR family regulator
LLSTLEGVEGLGNAIPARDLRRSLVNLDHVRTFLAVFDSGGFQDAGAQLRLAQPTVSQQLRKLEAYLGRSLLVRRRGNCVLTPHGERFLPYARSLVRTATRIDSCLGSGGASVGASSNVGIYLLQRHLRRCRESGRGGAPPELRISTNPEVHRWLLSGEVDLGAVEWWPETPGFECIPWREERLVAILPPGHPWGDRPALSLDVLLEEPLLGGEGGTGTGTLLGELLGPRARRLRMGPRLGSTEAVKEAVKAGLGVSVVLESAVLEEAQAGSLLMRPFDSERMAKRILLVLSGESPATSPARLLVRELLASSSSRGEPSGKFSLPRSPGRPKRPASTSRGGTP